MRMKADGNMPDTCLTQCGQSMPEKPDTCRVAYAKTI